VPIKAGDFLAFDSRLPHTSCHPKAINNLDIQNDRAGEQIPKEKSKMVLYWNSCSEESVSGFIKNTIKRAKKERQSESVKEIFFMDYLKNSFPDDFPGEFVDNVHSNKIKVASLNRTDSYYWKNEYSQLIEEKESGNAV
jgi:hypothetical protein